MKNDDWHAGANECKYFYLRSISEPKDNTLRVVIEEAGAAEKLTSREVGDAVFTDLRQIESNERSRLYEITWNEYVAYSVRNESYAKLDESEKVESGRLLCEYSKSHFLDYASRATFATNEYPGPMRHIGINCLNHIIDVVSVELPEVRQLRSTAKPN
jgi:hypothetical protein